MLMRVSNLSHHLKVFFLNRMEKKPTYILVENVKGFETSQTRELLIECLSCCGYTYQEFLLTPLQFGIPNCRLRYYLVAKCCGSFNFSVSPQVGHFVFYKSSINFSCLCFYINPTMIHMWFIA